MEEPVERRRSRSRGCLLGAACGDGLGAPFEGSRLVDEAALTAWMSSTKPLRITDDTVMMAVLAEHLAATVATGADLDEDMLVAGFLQSWQADPHRGYGTGTRRLFAEVARGAQWREARFSSFRGQGSYGDGAAMRVAPVGLLPWPVPDVAALARRSAEVTHTHELGWQGAVLQACAVAVARDSNPAAPLNRDTFLDCLGKHVQASTYLAQLQRLRFLPTTATPHEVATRIGNSSTAMEAVPAAIAAFLRYPDEPAAAIRFAVLIGGDTDTIATMAGALAGARCGEVDLPHAWPDRLEQADRLRDAADALLDAPTTPPARIAD